MANQKFHTWIGTIAALITIFAWLTGIHSISIPTGGSSIEFTFSDNTSGVILFIVSHLFVWGSFFFIAFTFGRFAYSKKVPLLPFYIFIGIIGYVIEIALYDAFFSAESISLYKIITGSYINNTGTDFLGELLTAGLPTAICAPLYYMILDGCCQHCGKMDLNFLDEKTFTPYERKEYKTYYNGDQKRRVMKIKRMQDYERKKECGNCGTIWTFRGTYSLGEHEYDK